MSIEFLQNHIALASSSQINEICKPLAKLGITYFSFVRSFQDGSHIRLSNNAAWTQHYYSRGFYNVVTKQVPDAEGNLLWSTIDRYPLFHDASEFFDVDNGTVLVVTADDVVERYFFGSTRENKQVNYIYIHKLDLLKRFILYFKEVAGLLINQAAKTKIIIPKLNSIDEDQNYYNDELLQDFLEDIKITKVSIRTKGEDFYVSPNMAKILSLMKYGCCTKEISKKVGLTSKTVEGYRDKLKNQLDLGSSGNLALLANSNSLLEVNLLK
jgi:hypothetical protein